MTAAPDGAGGTEVAALAHALQGMLRRRGALGLRRASHPGAPPAAPPSGSPAGRRAPASPAAAPDPAPEARSETPKQPQAPSEPRRQSLAAQVAARPQARPDARPDSRRAPAPPGRGTFEPQGPPPQQVAAASGSLDALRESVAACQACELCQSRTQTVFMDGQGSSRIMFVGEAPGADEDRQGVPFVGRAGELLTSIITKGMGLARQDVTIANVLKCRPPGNRDPLPSEKDLCTAFLDRQIELVDPAVLVPLGRHAASHLLGVDAPLGRLRGKVHDRDGRKVVPTYHPAYLLRSPHDKKKAWADIQLAMAEAGIPVPGRGQG